MTNPPRVNVIIPFRDGPRRSENLKWVTAYYRHRLPEATVHVERSEGTDPFNKSRTVNRAFDMLPDSDVTIIADVDCFICDMALRMAVENAYGRLVLPHRNPCYMTQGQSDWILNHHPPTSRVGGKLYRKHRRKSPAVGGVWVIDSELFAERKMEDRILGWGPDDLDFVEQHPHIRFQGPIYHLWHPLASREHVKHGYTIFESNRRNRKLQVEQGLIYGK